MMKSQYKSSLRIRAFKTYACALLTFSLQSNAYSATIFSSGWENSPGTGCTAPAGVTDLHLTDNGKWNDHVGGDPCHESNNGWTGPSMSVVSGEKRSGKYSLRFTAPDVSWQPNGAGGKVVKYLPNLTDMYFSAYVKWSSNFRFKRDADYKWVISETAAGERIYVQFRGGTDPTTAYPIAASYVPGPYYDVVFSDYSFLVNVGKWHHIEFHILSGSNGKIEVRIDGRMVNLRSDSGAVPITMNTGGARTSVFPDNTIGPYSGDWFPNNVVGDAYWWIDDVVINNNGWVTPSGLQAPANLRIIQ